MGWIVLLVFFWVVLPVKLAFVGTVVCLIAWVIRKARPSSGRDDSSWSDFGSMSYPSTSSSTSSSTPPDASCSSDSNFDSSTCSDSSSSSFDSGGSDFGSSGD